MTVKELLSALQTSSISVERALIELLKILAKEEKKNKERR